MNKVLPFPSVKPLPEEAARILGTLERAIEAAAYAAERLRECAAEMGNTKHCRFPAFEVDREMKLRLMRAVQCVNLAVIDSLESKYTDPDTARRG